MIVGGVASIERVGWSPPVVWIDVEPRTAQPWPSSTTAQRLENRYVVEGIMRALRDAGKSYGLYSYTNGWQEIVGSWRLPGVPVWATAGQLDYPNEALDRVAAAFGGSWKRSYQFTQGVSVTYPASLPTGLSSFVIFSGCPSSSACSTS